MSACVQSVSVVLSFSRIVGQMVALTQLNVSWKKHPVYKSVKLPLLGGMSAVSLEVMEVFVKMNLLGQIFEGSPQMLSKTIAIFRHNFMNADGNIIFDEL